MADETATQATARMWEQDMRIDRRKRTAAALTNLISREIAPFLGDEERAREYAARAIYGIIMDQGLFVLTEQDRIDLGLPPRDDKGWTADEIRAYEAHLSMLMTRPLPHLVMPNEKPAQR